MARVPGLVPHVRPLLTGKLHFSLWNKWQHMNPKNMYAYEVRCARWAIANAEGVTDTFLLPRTDGNPTGKLPGLEREGHSA